MMLTGIRVKKFGILLDYPVKFTFSLVIVSQIWWVTYVDCYTRLPQIITNQIGTDPNYMVSVIYF